jgi:hypothetical protein
MTTSFTLDTYNLPAKFDTSLKRVLEHLGHSHWFEPLWSLAQRFDGTPQVLDTPFDAELLNMLHMLVDARTIDAEASIDVLAAIRMGRFISFHLRGFKRVTGGALSYWNPLTESWAEFSAGDSKVQLIQSSEAFPPGDVIKRWARDHLTAAA